MLIKYLLLLAIVAVPTYVIFLEVYPLFDATTDRPFKTKVLAALSTAVLALLLGMFGSWLLFP